MTGPANILLVDDHEENLLALEAILDPLGHRLVSVTSGSAALKQLLLDDFACSSGSTHAQLCCSDLRSPRSRNQVEGGQDQSPVQRPQSPVAPR